jgi:hypothetical protein
VKPITAFELEQEIIEHEALIDEAEALVVVGEVSLPDGFGYYR